MSMFPAALAERQTVVSNSVVIEHVYLERSD